MKTSVALFKVTSLGLLLASSQAVQARPPIFQLGPISQAICSQVPFASRQMFNITQTLKNTRAGLVDMDRALDFVSSEQEKIGTTLIPAFNTALSNPGGTEERMLAQRVVTSLTNSLSTCNSSIRAQILLPKLVSDEAIDIVNADCFLPLEQVNKSFCTEPAADKCGNDGRTAAARHWAQFKRINGANLCDAISKYTFTEIEVDAPITTCDQAYNDAVFNYADEQLAMHDSMCKGEDLAQKRGSSDGETAAALLTCDQILNNTHSMPNATKPQGMSDDDFFNTYQPEYNSTYQKTHAARRASCQPPVVVTPAPAPIRTPAPIPMPVPIPTPAISIPADPVPNDPASQFVYLTAGKELRLNDPMGICKGPHPGMPKFLDTRSYRLVDGSMAMNGYATIYASSGCGTDKPIFTGVFLQSAEDKSSACSGKLRIEASDKGKSLKATFEYMSPVTSALPCHDTGLVKAYNLKRELP